MQVINKYKCWLQQGIFHPHSLDLNSTDSLAEINLMRGSPYMCIRTHIYLYMYVYMCIYIHVLLCISHFQPFTRTILMSNDSSSCSLGGKGETIWKRETWRENKDKRKEDRYPVLGGHESRPLKERFFDNKDRLWRKGSTLKLIKSKTFFNPVVRCECAYVALFCTTLKDS